MYKIIYNNSVIDVVKYPTFIMFLKNGNITVTDKTSAEGIMSSDNIPYCFNSYKNYKKVTIKEIDEKEFERLKSLLDSEQNISADEAELAKAKIDKISRLSTICKNKIVAGFSVELSGIDCQFKLTTEDQLNLMLIENQLISGETSFIYHATNEPCKIYTREDMLKIIKAYKAHTLYHTTYFNAAKQYIKSMVDIEKINFFNYGDDVLEFIDDPIIKSILKTGGVR